MLICRLAGRRMAAIARSVLVAALAGSMPVYGASAADYSLDLSGVAFRQQMQEWDPNWISEIEEGNEFFEFQVDPGSGGQVSVWTGSGNPEGPSWVTRDHSQFIAAGPPAGAPVRVRMKFQHREWATWASCSHKEDTDTNRAHYEVALQSGALRVYKYWGPGLTQDDYASIASTPYTGTFGATYWIYLTETREANETDGEVTIKGELLDENLNILAAVSVTDGDLGGQPLISSSNKRGFGNYSPADGNGPKIFEWHVEAVGQEPLVGTSAAVRDPGQDVYGNRPDESTAEAQLPSALDAGDVVNQFPNPDGIRGLTFKDGNLWGVTESGTLYEMDPDTGLVLSTVAIAGGGSHYGLAWDPTRNNFGVTDASSDVLRLVTPTGVVEATLETAGGTPVGAAYDSTRDGYWVSEGDDDSVYLLDADTGAVVSTLSAASLGASRIAGTGYDALNDVLLLNSRDDAQSYVMRASDGSFVASFPSPPSASTNNGQGATTRPSNRTGYLTNYEAPTTLAVDLGLEGPAVGGSLSGLVGWVAGCINRTSPQSARMPMGGGTDWDCEAAGVTVSPGDAIVHWLVGAAGSTIAGGTLTGQSGLVAHCINRTNPQSVAIPMNGGTHWNCAAAGMIVSPGDVISHRVVGLAN